MSNDSVVDREHDVARGHARARARIAGRKLTTARCGTHTPFGLPVEPEV